MAQQVNRYLSNSADYSPKHSEAAPYNVASSPFLVLTAPIQSAKSARAPSPTTLSPTSRSMSSSSAPTLSSASSPPTTPPTTYHRAPSTGPGSAHFRSKLHTLVNEYVNLGPGHDTAFSNLPMVQLINRFLWNAGSRLTEKDVMDLQSNLQYRIALVFKIRKGFEELGLGAFDIAGFDFEAWYDAIARNVAKRELFDLAYAVVMGMERFQPLRKEAKSVFAFLTPMQYLAAAMADKVAPMSRVNDEYESLPAREQILDWCAMLQDLGHLSIESFEG